MTTNGQVRVFGLVGRSGGGNLLNGLTVLLALSRHSRLYYYIIFPWYHNNI